MSVEWDPVRPGETVASELEGLAKYCLEHGAKAISYHITPPFNSQVSKKSSVHHFGYDDGLSKLYRDPQIMENDPIPDFVMHVGHVMTWNQIIGQIELSDKQREFLRLFREKGFIDGVACPLFGPVGRNSYFSIDFDRELSLEDEAIVRPMVDRAQSCHRRICAMIRRKETAEINLSPRESEIIYWIARGKTNPEMAIILGISESSVVTYVRRMFKKLDATDRVSAVINGLERSLVQLD
ncbi:helix-turn-helix transcriptional regulator [Qipengyuania aquimaris]|uniref:helix-turn-helix transcriptional regulator n=1 Tax=Qipengyuania aquimaris TaxID=255984 RepID=UPI001CD35342|nr:LuxR C-terminal-related transcriptional regulator [Qipengyuania aquimaris]MCA0902639.1 LuxR C-terminal-related transcriptional regulator [Qipengyuania aquimaris]